jgi:hypothetical protein
MNQNTSSKGQFSDRRRRWLRVKRAWLPFELFNPEPAATVVTNLLFGKSAIH